ncbi:MAG: 30S ribosomal protein S6 [Acidimicrobiales bacterium]
MRAYELMVIFDGDLDDQAVESAVRRVQEQVGGKGSDVRRTDRWGKRRFAYEINHKHDGYYVVYEFLAGGEGLEDLERQFRLADEIVRHKLIRLPDAEAARRGLDAEQAPASAGSAT